MLNTPRLGIQLFQLHILRSTAYAFLFLPWRLFRHSLWKRRTVLPFSESSFAIGTRIFSPHTSHLPAISRTVPIRTSLNRPGIVFHIPWLTRAESAPACLSGREYANEDAKEVPVINQPGPRDSVPDFRLGGSRSSGGTRRSSPKSSRMPNTTAPIIKPRMIMQVSIYSSSGAASRLT